MTNVNWHVVLTVFWTILGLAWMALWASAFTIDGIQEDHDLNVIVPQSIVALIVIILFMSLFIRGMRDNHALVILAMIGAAFNTINLINPGPQAGLLFSSNIISAIVMLVLSYSYASKINAY